MTEAQTPTPAKAKPRRLEKNITDSNILEISVIGGKKGKMTFDYKQIKDAKIQAYLPALALNHRLGDAAAGREGADAEEAILAVWNGLLKGEMTVKAPAQPKVAVNTVKQNLEKLSPAERAAAAKVLEALGIKL